MKTEEIEEQVFQKLVGKIRVLPVNKWKYTSSPETTSYGANVSGLQVLLKKSESSRTSRAQDSCDEWIDTEYKTIYYNLVAIRDEHTNVSFEGREEYEDGRRHVAEGLIDSLKSTYELVDTKVQNHLEHQRIKILSEEIRKQEKRERKTEQLKNRRIKKSLTIISDMF